MKKKLVFLALPALLLAFGMALAGCDNGSTGGGDGGGGGVASPTAAYLRAKDWEHNSRYYGDNSGVIKFTGTNTLTMITTFDAGGTGTTTCTYTLSGLAIKLTVTGSTGFGGSAPPVGTIYPGTFDAAQATTLTLVGEDGGTVVCTRKP